MTTTASAPRNAAAYLRLSPRPDGAYDLGLERQRQDCRAKAKALGWKITREFIDEDRSAYKGHRPAYQSMMTAIKSRAIDGVLAYNLDRLYRSNRELEDGITLCESQRFPLVTADGEVDLSGGDGQFQARILVAVARKSSDDESRRMKRKHVQLAEQGRPAGGSRPFGYADDRVTIDKGEARLIREAMGAVFRGASIHSLCRDWNARGITSPRGNQWRQFTLKHVLISPRLAGLRAHRGVVVGPAVWKGIITEEEHVRLKAILTDPARSPANATRARSYLLTGWLTCSLCGAKLVARPNASHVRCYVCTTGPGFSGCGKIRILAEPTEVHVTGMLLAALDSKELRAEVRRQRRGTGTAAAELAQVEKRMDDLAIAYAEARINQREWEMARQPLAAQLESLRDGLGPQTVAADALASHAGRGNVLKESWPALSLEEKRTIVGAVIDKVTVSPAVKGRNFFDPGRISVKWKV